MRVKVILNPTAGRGRAGKERELITRALAQYDGEFSLEETRVHNHATEIARQAVAAGYDLIIAAGGDGTVNQVVNGMAGSGIPLGILGCGTGNDFAAMIGMPKDTLSSIKQIMEGEVKWVDLCRVNRKYFISSVGAGFDGAVAHTVNHGFRWIRGMTAYLLGVFMTLFSYKQHPVRLQVDEETYEFKALLVAVNNATTYGGGIKINPEARIDDGLFNICAAKNMNFFEILCCLPLAVKGAHQRLKKVMMLQGKEVTLESKTPLYYQLDGEVLQDRILKFSIYPRSFPIKGAVIEPSAVCDPSTLEKVRVDAV